MEYGPAVKRRFDAPTHAGEWPPGTPDTLTGEAADRTLQVWVRFQLRTARGIVEKLGKLLKIEDALAACWREHEAKGATRASEGKGIGDDDFVDGLRGSAGQGSFAEPRPRRRLACGRAAHGLLRLR